MLNLTSLKSPMKSRGVWGGIVSMGAAVGLATGWYTLTAEDQMALPILMSAVASGVGGVLAVFGRIRATRQIG